MVLAPLGIELGIWIIAFGALIFCLLCVYIAKALFGVAGNTLGKLPVVGGWINSGLGAVEHKIVSVMSTAAEGAQALCGLALHAIAREIDWIGREIKNHSNLLALLATLTLGGVSAVELQSLLRGIRALIHANTGSLSHAHHRLDNAEKRLAHGIGEDVLPRIRGLERELDRVVEHDIASLRHRAKTLEREYQRLFKWTRTHALEAGTLAFAGAVALALRRLGLGWLRCNSLSRLGRRIGCGGFGLLEELFATAVISFAVLDICDFAVAAQAVAQEFVPELIALVDVENALIGCHGATAAPVLALPALHLPPTNLGLPLAA